MSKGLEALKILKTTAITTSSLVKEAIEHIEEYIEEQATTIEKDLEVLDVIKKFFFIEVYSDKRLNSDFCKITAIEDKEANIDRSALSFIDRDSLKILKEWLENL